MTTLALRRDRVRSYFLMGMSWSEYLRKLVTPFNAVVAAISIVGIPIILYRLFYGIGAATNLTDTNPWGIWIGFDMMTGVALAAGGFVIGTAVHLFGMTEYRMLVRPAILTGFLGYLFAVFGLMLDLGRYYRLPYPMAVSFGVNSILFLVAWHVALYLSCQLAEWCPAIFESLNMPKLRQWFLRLTVGATAFGVILSTLHQSALGSLFLLMPSKVHPLWYSSYLSILFFVSAIAAGISMIVVESMLSHRVFSDQVSKTGIDHRQFDKLTVGLGKAAAAVLFTYFFLKLIAVAHDANWDLIPTAYGAWWLVEMLGFVALPAALYTVAVRRESAFLVKVASVITVAGIALNRLNLSVICFNWNVPDRYVPSWMEVVVSITLISLGLVTFRWIVNRMPILYDHPDYPVHHETSAA